MKQRVARVRIMCLVAFGKCRLASRLVPRITMQRWIRELGKALPFSLLFLVLNRRLLQIIFLVRRSRGRSRCVNMGRITRNIVRVTLKCCLPNLVWRTRFRLVRFRITCKSCLECRKSCGTLRNLVAVRRRRTRLSTDRRKFANPMWIVGRVLCLLFRKVRRRKWDLGILIWTPRIGSWICFTLRSRRLLFGNCDA